VSKLAVEEARGSGAIEELRVEWQALFACASRPSPYVSWEWIAAWHRWLGQGLTPRLFCARAGSRLVGLLPLAEEACWGVRPGQIRRLSFMGERWVAGDYLDVLAATGWEQAAAGAIFEHLAGDGSFDVLELDGLAGDSRSLPQLAWRFGVDPRFKFQVVPAQICPIMTLDGSWDDVVARTRRPNQFKRLCRGLHSLPGFQTRSAVAPDDVGPALERLLALHDKRWAAQGGSDAMTRPAVKDFHRDVVVRLASAGLVRFEELWIDGSCRASYYGMQSGDHYYLYQCGYDPAWAKHSVAFTRLGLSIQDAAARALPVYDFLRDNETYKFDCANATRVTLTVQVAQHTQPATLFLARRQLGAAAKTALKAGLPSSGLDWLRRRRRSWEERQDLSTPRTGRASETRPQPLSNATRANL